MKDKYENVARLILRLSLGLIFAYAGIDKIFMNGISPAEKIFPMIPAEYIVWIVGLIELIIGVFLIVGLYTKTCGWVGSVVAVLFIGSVVYLSYYGEARVVWDSVFQLKDLGIFGMSLFFALEGSAEYSLDKQLG